MESLPTSLSAIYSLIILIPGFVTLFVERTISYRRNETGIIVVAKALVYSFLNYVIFSLTSLTLMTFKSGPVSAQHNQIEYSTDKWGLLVILTISILNGIIFGLFINKDWHMRFARYIKLTRRTSRESIWLDLFHDKYIMKSKEKDTEEAGAYLVVYLKDGRRLYGWPEYSADEFSEGPVVFLTEAAWLTEENDVDGEIPYPGILITGNQIEYIQLYNPE